MKRFLQTLLLFSLLLLVLDLPFRWAMSVLPTTEYDGRLRRLLHDSMRYDLLVMGSSRAARDVMPQEIAKVTGITAFNLGYPGGSIEFHEFLLRQILLNEHRPRTILLVVDDPSELMSTSAVDFRLDRTYPLAGNDRVNDEICRRTGKSRILTHLLASYRIKESLSQLWNPPKPDRFDTVFADGSMTSMLRSEKVDTLMRSLDDRPYAPENESMQLRDTFIRFVKACADNGICLVIVHPPDLRPPSSAFNERLSELTSGRAETYHYDTSVAAYRDTAFYYDIYHLNREGARLFSAELGRFLLEKDRGRASR